MKTKIDFKSSQEEYTDSEKIQLLVLARNIIETYLKSGQEIEPEIKNEKFLRPRGVFVTLTKKDKLRGCIGYIEPIKPLAQAIKDNAIAAATLDNRFLPVSVDELNDLKVEISILTLPQADTIENIIKEKRGVILRQGNRGATYLPQVWNELSDPKVFFTTLCAKGGLPDDCYLDSETEIRSYQAVVFSEK